MTAPPHKSGTARAEGSRLAALLLLAVAACGVCAPRRPRRSSRRLALLGGPDRRPDHRRKRALGHERRHKFQQVAGKGLSLIEFSQPFAECATTCDADPLPDDAAGKRPQLRGDPGLQLELDVEPTEPSTSRTSASRHDHRRHATTATSATSPRKRRNGATPSSSASTGR